MKKIKKTVDRLGKRVYKYYYLRLIKKVDGDPSSKHEGPTGFDSPSNGRI
jgi:hypothetical protein